MIDVEIRNFQAIDDLTLQVEGFTALVGRTNIGKSSIVRALKSALSGGSGSDFVRHDAKTCARLLSGTKSCKCFSSVKVMFAEGQGFLWEKGSKGINRYTVWKDGVASVYDRVGQSMELPEVLGSQFAPVKLGPSQALLQVSSQFESPFLLDLTGNVVADILSDIGQLDDINQAMAAVSKDRRAAISTRKVREGDVAELGKQLDRYEHLDAHLVAVEAVRARGAQVALTSERLALADRFIREAGEGTKAIRRITAALAVPVPVPTAVQDASGALARVSHFREEWAARSTSISALDAALTTKVPDGQQLDSLAERWRRVRTWQMAWGDREAGVSRLARVEKLALPADAPRARVGDLQRVVGWLDALVRMKQAFERFNRVVKLPTPDVGAITRLSGKLAETHRLAQVQDRLERDLERVERELREARVEGKDILAEFEALGVCPTCHQDIAAEHVVACVD